MGIYRTTRNIEASLIDYITTQINASWTGVAVEKTFARIYDIDLPSICVASNVSSHEKAEIGSDSTVRTVQILINIFGSSDGNKLDLTDFLVEKLKGGCVYYNYVIENGVVKTKTADGRIRVTDVTITPLNFTEDRNNLDPHDRFRNLITLEVGLGKIET